MVVAAEESCTKVIIAAAEENHAKVTISSAEKTHVKTTVAADENDDESRAKARRLASLPKSPAYEISWVERCKESHAKKCCAIKCRAKVSHAEDGHTKARLVTAQPPLRKSLAYPEGVHFAEPYDPHKTQLDGRKDNSAHEWARAVKRSEEEARATVPTDSA
ncbi:hypothetical protein BGZ99_008103 [Dissophora globulifera]|uniref:Uncharacterized protein n=1 Tax=Dissophora globulifera TaxID=979702 RepID=A0A9P6RW03_9FUNG|nr:hypothetical protein BGZ99_008103 [Dissophora globulifera]